MEHVGYFDILTHEEYNEYMRLHIHRNVPAWLTYIGWFIHSAMFWGALLEPAPFSGIACLVVSLWFGNSLADVIILTMNEEEFKASTRLINLYSAILSFVFVCALMLGERCRSICIGD
jgi:hypothetical protein